MAGFWDKAKDTAAGGVVGNILMGPAGAAAGVFQGAAGGGALSGLASGGGGSGGGAPNTAGAMPQMQAYKSATDEAGNLKGPYAVDKNAGTIDVNRYRFNPETSGYQAFKQRATQQGPSAWANMQMQKQQIEQQQGANQASRLAASGAAQARSGLGMRGGYGGGAATSLAKEAMRGRNRALQSNAQQGNLNRLGISSADEQQKLQLLSQLPGAESQQNQMALAQQQFYAGLEGQNALRQQQNQMYNTGNALRDLGGLNQANQNTYQQQMAAYGANRTADAMNAPQKQGFLGNIWDKTVGGIF